MRGPDPLASPSIGTAGDDLIEPCRERSPRPATPEPAAPQPAFALAFSGGGFRASLSAMGLLRFMADAGLLGRVRYVSSVSGGSVTNGLLATAWSELQSEGFHREAFDRRVLEPLVAKVARRSLEWKLLRNAWRIVGRRTRTQLLADAFDDWWFGGRRLSALPHGVRWIVNAANVTTGVRFAFERDVVGDYVIGYVSTSSTGLRLAEAVASSAAVPGALAPFVVRGLDFPCQNGREVKLLDGGAYDNSGLGALEAVTAPHDGVTPCIVGINAGGLFRTGRYGGIPVLRDLTRAEALLYRQSTALRRQQMVERFRAWEDAVHAGRTAAVGPPRCPVRARHDHRADGGVEGRPPRVSRRRGGSAPPAGRAADLVRPLRRGALPAAHPPRMVAGGRHAQPVPPRPAARRAPDLEPAAVSRRQRRGSPKRRAPTANAA